MNQKSRSLTIDAIKGAAILLVMAGHVLVWNHMEDGIIYDVIKVIQMPLFILVSGYLCGMGRKISSLSAYGAKLKKRALSYLTPFFFWIVLQHPLHPMTNIVETLFGLDKGLWFLMTLFLLTLMVYTAELAGAVAERSFGALGGKIVFWAVYLGLAAAVLLHVGIIVVVNLLGHALHLDAVEKASMIYSNAGNLIIPIVTAVLGKEWVIYSSAFLSVQLFLLWSHAKSMLCGEKSFELKKVLTNINMIAILAGAALFLLHIQLPAVIEDSLDMVGSAIGPISMIILGMLMAGMNFKKILGYRRLWLVTALRLVGIPLAAVALLKLSGLAHLVPDGQTILLVSLLATCTPSASTITQMAQIYGKDADYASAINVVTTLLCIFTMPLMVALYQL